jgi:hypothetical protein
VLLHDQDARAGLNLAPNGYTHGFYTQSLSFDDSDAGFSKISTQL